MGNAFSTKTKEVKIKASMFVNKSTESFYDSYTIGPKLGLGSFGEVSECTLKSEPTVKRAVKILKRSNLNLE
jgi:hypothetical protein